jgi:GDP-L-fucose synthase
VNTIGRELNPHSRIYLAGHTGLVGGGILRELRARGYDNLIYRTIEELDLTDQAETRAFFAEEKPEVVIVAAARVGGIMANWRYPYEFIQENLGIELNVIHEAYRSAVKRLIFLGSSCIYPREAPQPLKEEYLLTGPLEETNRAYAIAKIAGIELCRSLNREYGTDYLCLMPTNMYGPGDNFDLETSHLVPALIRKFHEGKGNGAPVVLWGTGTPRRELMHVDDLAMAIALFLEGGALTGIPNALVNVGTGRDCTIAELAETVRRVVGYEGEIQWDRSKPDGTPHKLLDMSLARSLGWEARIGLEKGLRQSYEWYLRALHHVGAPGEDHQ